MSNPQPPQSPYSQEWYPAASVDGAQNPPPVNSSYPQAPGVTSWATPHASQPTSGQPTAVYPTLGAPVTPGAEPGAPAAATRKAEKRQKKADIRRQRQAKRAQRDQKSYRPGWAAVLIAALLAGGIGAGGTAAVMNSHVEALTYEPPASTALPQVSNPSSGSNTPGDWAAAADHVRPSVVAIQVRSGQSGSQGSGVIIDDSGNIVTNHHVIEGADQIQVMLHDGRVLGAELQGSDEATDLAVIQLIDAPDDLATAELGTSKDLVVGQAVMAVGNPLGLSSTVTTGIISALDRPVSAGDGRTVSTVTNAIQIDAAINPGNSGGPLFNATGQVIGINSSIATTSRDAGSVGLGFAIPVDLVANIAGQLIEDGVAEHAYLGVTLGDATATVDGVTRVGALVGDVLAGTPAELAGIKSGDVIIAIDDHAVGSAEALTGFVRTYRAGVDVTITLVRDGQEQNVSATLTAREDA